MGVEILDRTDLARFGAATLGEVLLELPWRKHAIDIDYISPFFTDFGSSDASIRGLGVSRALLLVNGRRYLSGSAGAATTVDPNLIPLAAIERVEIREHGGAAVYGAGAVSGVANVVTRTSIDSAEASAYSSVAVDEFSTWQASFAAGASPGGANAIVAGEYILQDAPCSYYIYAPSSACPGYEALMPSARRLSLFSAGDVALDEHVRAFYQAAAAYTPEWSHYQLVAGVDGRWSVPSLTAEPVRWELAYHHGRSDTEAVHGGHLEASGVVAEFPWGGHLATALGAELRTTSERPPSPQPYPSTLRILTVPDVLPVAHELWAANAELSLVPLAGRPGARWLELSAAMHRFDDSRIGSGVNWELGGLWKIGAGFAVRAGYGSALQIPSISDVFRARYGDRFYPADPCDATDGRSSAEQYNCSNDGVPDTFVTGFRQLPLELTRDPDLQPEQSRTLTTELVYQASGIHDQTSSKHDLTLSAGYFDIETERAITLASPYHLYNGCYRRINAARVTPYCDAIERDPDTYRIERISAMLTNAGRSHSAGLDVRGQYRYQSPHSEFRLSARAARMLTFEHPQGIADILTSDAVIDPAIIPKWIFRLSTLWRRGRVSLGAQLRSQGRWNDSRGGASNGYFYTIADVHGGYSFTWGPRQLDLTVGVNNLADASTAEDRDRYLTPAWIHDSRHRAYYARLSHRF
ncbi:TonB-dependent receptor plug domain-containing protein [Haliangium sp.]|uniref:TonB-dependent receptor plug domain-containing protein n=1 Tax=Haliangium sp. TaxID=2663208 RepID=UPI003D0AD41F